MTKTFINTVFATAFFLSIPLAAFSASAISCPDIASAEEGSILDEYLLAKSYDEGYCNIKVSKTDAEYWYRKAALQGHALAQYELGETFFTGDGFPIDYVEAKKWYTAAAHQGNGLSQLRLAFLNAEAHFEGLTPDYAEAEKWFTKAAEQNAGDAQFRLGNFYNNYKTPPDHGKGFIWLKRAADNGHRVAMFDLGRMFMDGKGVAKNTALGLEWLKRAADSDLLQAQMTLAEIYSTGTPDIGKSPRDAMKWILKIAAKPTASVFYLNRAGDIFFEGWEGIAKNYPAARKYYERAAAKNDAHARSRLADIYAQGLGVEKDPVKASEYASPLPSNDP